MYKLRFWIFAHITFCVLRITQQALYPTMLADIWKITNDPEDVLLGVVDAS